MVYEDSGGCKRCNFGVDQTIDNQRGPPASIYQLLYAEFLLDELEEHKAEIIFKMHANQFGYERALSIITRKVRIVRREAYSPYLDEARAIIGAADKDDVAYIAVAMGINTDGLWSYDPHFKQQNAVKLFSTGELLNIIKKGKF